MAAAQPADRPHRARPPPARAPAGAGVGPAPALRRRRRGGRALGVRPRAAGVRAGGRPGEGAGHPPRRVQAPDADGARGPAARRPRGRTRPGRAVLRPAAPVQGRRDAAGGLARGLRGRAVDRGAAADAARAAAGLGRRSGAVHPAVRLRRRATRVLPPGRRRRASVCAHRAAGLVGGARHRAGVRQADRGQRRRRVRRGRSIRAPRGWLRPAIPTPCAWRWPGCWPIRRSARAWPGAP